MKKIEEYIGNSRRIVISGHIHPDGDCVGSCLGLRNYILTIHPEAQVDVYLEGFSPNFRFLDGADQVQHTFPARPPYDLAFALDSGDEERLGEAGVYFREAGYRVCIDHHITNVGYGDENVICPEASSTSEVLYRMMDEKRINKETAECLYMGIVHDTGVFKHSNTSEETMQAAGRLISRGARPSFIIDETFYKKTFVQNQALGRVLSKAQLFLGGAFITGVLTGRDMEELGISSKELDGIVDQLRVTQGTEVAAFLYESQPGTFKVSLRSNNQVDVSRIAAGFGGGGHVKAAGCTLAGTPEEITDTLAGLIREQL